MFDIYECIRNGEIREFFREHVPLNIEEQVQAWKKCLG